MGVVVHGGQGMVVPRLLSAILRRHSEFRARALTVLLSDSRSVVWLLRNDGGDVFKDLVERLMTLPPSAEIKVCVYSKRSTKAMIHTGIGRGTCDHGKVDAA